MRHTEAIAKEYLEEKLIDIAHPPVETIHTSRTIENIWCLLASIQCLASELLEQMIGGMIFGNENIIRHLQRQHNNTYRLW